jgi:hypothetical protein
MAAMAAVLSSAIMAFVRSGAAVAIASSAERMAKAALGAIVAAVLVAASVVCALAALWIWEVPRLGPAGAPLVVAGILFVVGLVALGVMQHTLRAGRPSSHSYPAPDLLLADAMHLFKDHKGTVLMAALIAGLMAGRNEK